MSDAATTAPASTSTTHRARQQGYHGTHTLIVIVLRFYGGKLLAMHNCAALRASTAMRRTLPCKLPELDDFTPQGCYSQQ